MTDPIEPEDTEDGDAPPNTDRPELENEHPTEHPPDERPTTHEIRAAEPVEPPPEEPEAAPEHARDPGDHVEEHVSGPPTELPPDDEITLNLTGDIDATVNLSGGEVLLRDRDDSAIPPPPPQTPQANAEEEASAGAEKSEDDKAGEVARAHLKGLLEALIFASDKPIKTSELAKSASAPTRQVKELLEELHQEYAPRGLQLDEVAGGWIFRTSAAYAPFVRDLTKQKPVKLSRAQIETLAILAYRQPITRPEIDEIRGVDCGPVLKMLLERDLIRILGKKDEPGRPLIYGTTTQFLEFFGLKSLRDLPTLREFTDLNEESLKVVEEELGEAMPTMPGVEDAGGSSGSSGDVAPNGVMPGDTVPPQFHEEDETALHTEIPPAMGSSPHPDAEPAGDTEGAESLPADTTEEPVLDVGADEGKAEKEIDPEEEFPDDDDADFDDEDEDEEDEEEDEDEKE
ncbi:MAG TPA: SMC-Scp complex subunit ScpB [Polyangiaceae bacterium]